MIAALKKRCKYWEILHPVFADRTSSYPKFTADNLQHTDVFFDLLGEGNKDFENLDDNDNSNIGDNGSSSSSRKVSARLEGEPDREGVKKGKKPMRLETPGPQKKSKPSLADALLA